jgi:CheY-like chemotaxis protein
MLETGPLIIVDDDPDDLALIKEVCRMLRIPNQLLLFNGAEQILKYFKTTNDQPFLILCDINMPQINGLELRKIMSEDETIRKKAIPFIFLSTSAIQSQVNTAYDMTVQGFFEKGHSFEKLQHKIHLILEYWKECKHPHNLKSF